MHRNYRRLVRGNCYSDRTWASRGALPGRACATFAAQCLMLTPSGALYQSTLRIPRAVDLRADDVSASI
eukprot:2608684-Pyramimonas_sp.AAC.1